MLESSQCHSNSWERTIYSFLLTIICLRGQLFDCTDTYLLLRTIMRLHGQLYVCRNGQLWKRTIVRSREHQIVRQPNNNPWKRIIIHGNEWIVRTKEHLSVPKDSCSFPRIIVRLHEQLSVRTVSSEVYSVHVPVGLRTTNYNISVSFISSHFSLHFMSDKSWHCIHSYIPTRLIR